MFLKTLSINELSSPVSSIDKLFDHDRAAWAVFSERCTPILCDFLDCGSDIPACQKIPEAYGYPANVVESSLVAGTIRQFGMTAINLHDAVLWPANYLCLNKNKFPISDYLGEYKHNMLLRAVSAQITPSLDARHHSTEQHLPTYTPTASYDRAIDFSTDLSDTNVFHWLSRVLPKLKIIRKLDAEIPILFSYKPTAFQLESLTLLDVPNPIIIIEHSEPSHFKQLLLIEGDWSYLNSEMVTYLRQEVFGNPLMQYGLIEAARKIKLTRKLFIYRKNEWSRNLINRSEILELMESLGYTITTLEGVGLFETAALFSGADEIVYEHGACGVFLIFSNKNAKIIEFIPERVHISSEQPTNFWFWHCVITHRKYIGLICPNSKLDPWAEFSVDTNALLWAMETLGFDRTSESS
jgi:capsular polysaccharide biosynthesis protein